MDNTNPALRTALAAVGGLIIVLVIVIVMLMFTAGGGEDPLVTDTVPTTTATTTPPTTTSTTTQPATAPTTTSTTTQPAATTTEGLVDPSAFDNTTKTAAATGNPGSALTDVRLGDHVAFIRIVFDFEGDGTNSYEVGYEPGPSFSGSGGGTEVSPAGSVFLVVRITPGLTYDIDDLSPTYSGPTSFDPGIEPIREIAFVGDFEADMMWVIGLDAAHGFAVSTRVDPQRLVIDIAR